MTKLMKVNPLIDPDGAQSGSASYDSGISMLPFSSNPIQRTWGLEYLTWQQKLCPGSRPHFKDLLLRGSINLSKDPWLENIS